MIVQFQFSDHLVTRDFFTLLKAKLNESGITFQYSFLKNYFGKTIQRWEITYKTDKFMSSRLVNTVFYDRCACNLLYDENSKMLTCVNENWICEMQPDTGKMNKLLNVDLTYMKWITNEKHEKLLLGIYWNGGFGVWDWETKRVIKIPNSSLNEHLTCIVAIDDQAQELLGYSRYSTIQIWCLKTFTCKREFAMCGIAPLELCFLDKARELFIKTTTNGIEVWNKKTGDCLCKVEFDNNACLVFSVLCSVDMGLVIFNYYSKLVICKFKSNLKEELQFSNPFSQKIKHIQFLDFSKQTQVLVIDFENNAFVFDLVSKSMIWKMRNDSSGNFVSSSTC